MRLALDPDAPARTRAALSDWLAGHRRLPDVLLAASELVTNAVVHSDPASAQVVVRVERVDGKVRVVVSQPGSGEIRDSREAPPASQPTGRGIRIADAVSDRIGWCSDDEVRVWFEVDG